MPIWSVPARDYDLPRTLALLDTNVLVALFDPNDALHLDTAAAVDLGQFQWGVSEAVVIEAWNFLAGRVGRPELANQMLQWLLTPGNVILIGDENEGIETAHIYSQRHRVDIVDARLLDLADRI